MSTTAGYEKKDIDPWRVIIYGGLGIAILAVIIVVLISFFSVQKEQLYYEAVLEPESKELIELRNQENEVLNSYKILDPEKGIYQIPIERAMQLVAQ